LKIFKKNFSTEKILDFLSLQVFLLLVKRLTSLKYNSTPQQQQQLEEALRLNYSNRLLANKQHQLSSFKPEIQHKNQQNTNKFCKNRWKNSEERENNVKLLNSENDAKNCDPKLLQNHDRNNLVDEQEAAPELSKNNNHTQNMGSNVSRPSSGKGLSGRRTQSSSESFFYSL
jgi:hypothetical protein